nr:hypothetical protein B0A51_09310 [Rachicladosporium sp. CCFEE 5018]
MLPHTLLVFCLTATAARAQSSTESSSAAASDSSSTASSSSSGSSSSNDSTQTESQLTFSQTLVTVSTPLPESFTGTQYTYASFNGQSTRNMSSATVESQNATSSASSTNTQITRTSTSQTLTALVGGGQTSSTGTASSTSTAPLPVNTQPCNGHVEFCNRSYGNITQVCAHNSAFAVKNNAGSNQQLGIEDQLNDGIGMLQGETHYVNNTIYNCHTSCDLLNAGTWQSELETVVSWLDRHPYEVLTMLIVNSDFTDVENYVPAIQNSGIERYLYIPPVTPMYREQWPTLGELILQGKRMIMFMDYDADVARVPYILDEFTHMTETAFSPQVADFRNCSIQRPPNLNQTLARTSLMNLVNQNLNTAVDLGALLGTDSTDAILISNTADINTTNGQLDMEGQLGNRANLCVEEWDRAPNWLLVDYYNFGDPGPGSVFEVAARMNGVTPAPAAPAEAPAKKKAAPKKAVKDAEAPVAETAAAKEDAPAPVAKSTKAGPPKEGDSIELEGFGGEVETHDGEKTTLSKLAQSSKSGVVLFTYPKASTPGCTTQVQLFRDAYDELTATGLVIYGLSTDSPKSNTTFATKQNIKYKLLCDPKATLIQAIGLKKSPSGTTRGVFVVDKEGKVLAAEAGGPAATVEVVKKLVKTLGGDAGAEGVKKAEEKADAEAGAGAEGGEKEVADTAAAVADTAEKIDSAA